MKQCLRITSVGIVLSLAFSSVIWPPPVAAVPSYSGAITGVFDTPMLTGAFLDAGSRLPLACDNTSGAGGSGVATSDFTWGDPHGGSALTFIGNPFSGMAPGQVFPLGTLSYFNGQNSPASLVFGLTMQLSTGDGITSPAEPVGIVSTLNGNRDRVADADALVFGEFEIPSTLAAFENTAVNAIVYGKIVGDSELEITSMSLAPGEVGHGCVSEGTLVDSLPCATACGDVCAAVTLAMGRPLCGSEQLPAALRAGIDRALHLLSLGAGKEHERKAKKSVRLAMKQLRRSATIASGASKKGRISAECAEAVSRAVGNAESQAEPWLENR